MKVKELIGELQKLDPEKEIKLADGINDDTDITDIELATWRKPQEYIIS